MSKQLFIDPNVVRKPGTIHFEDIPVNQYQKTVKDELGNFTKEQLVNIYRDMLTLREFETMINLIKTTGELHLRLSPRPFRYPCQGPVRHRKAVGRGTDGHHEGLPGWKDAGRRRKATP